MISNFLREKLWRYGILGAASGAIFLIYLLITSYVDVFSFCAIKVEGDMVIGNRGAIIAAIKMLKKQNKKSYQTLCGYVERIIENDCLAVEPRIDSSWKGLYADGCYIRGSKTIYIKPEKNGDSQSVANRSRALMRYADYSKRFWKEK